MRTNEIRLSGSSDKSPHIHVMIMRDGRLWFDVHYNSVQEFDMLMSGILEHFNARFGKTFIDSMKKWAETKDNKDLSELLKNINAKSVRVQKGGMN